MWHGKNTAMADTPNIPAVAATAAVAGVDDDGIEQRNGGVRFLKQKI
jgi:hypothetical protein